MSRDLHIRVWACGPTSSKMSRYFSVTIPLKDFEPYDELPDWLAYIKGQPERGESGYEHWQLLVVTRRKSRFSAVKKRLGSSAHVEASRSDALNEYVWKDDTCIDQARRFELGKLPNKRQSSTDWEEIWQAAKDGRTSDIPADIRLRLYSSIKRVEKDHMSPTAQYREVYVYWGASGAGKSKRAWEEADIATAYPKDPNTKFWDGYQGQENVVIDEFRGKIDIAHLLRWLDRYPVCVENKFGGVVFRAKKIWITSNLSWESWYPDLDEDTKQALRRRLTKVIHFHSGLMESE